MITGIESIYHKIVGFYEHWFFLWKKNNNKNANCIQNLLRISILYTFYYTYIIIVRSLNYLKKSSWLCDSWLFISFNMNIMAAVKTRGRLFDVFFITFLAILPNHRELVDVYELFAMSVFRSFCTKLWYIISTVVERKRRVLKWWFW